MATTTREYDPDLQSLELAIVEQRRDYDMLHSLHESVKIKTITFLAAALGLMAYLYTGDSGQNFDIKHKLFIPPEAYGIIFYVIGFTLVALAIAAFINVLIKERVWYTAFEDNQERTIMNDYLVYLEYTHQRYLTISKANGKTYEQRRYLLNISFIPLLLGGTILLVLKTFSS